MIEDHPRDWPRIVVGYLGRQIHPVLNARQKIATAPTPPMVTSPPDTSTHARTRLMPATKALSDAVKVSLASSCAPATAKFADARYG